MGINLFYAFYENKENDSDFLIKLFFPFYEIKHGIRINESIKNQTVKNLFSVKKSLSDKNYKFANFNFSEDGVKNSSVGNVELNFSYRNDFKMYQA